MLDPGRYFAEAIYFLQYTLAQILWAVDRSLLSIAVIAESVNSWLSENIGYFVQLLVNALSAPLGGLLILALTALGVWYALNTIVATSRWVDPGKLLTYGFIALAFFSAPLVAVDLLEDLRTAINAGIDEALIDDASGDIFNAGMDGTDSGLPAGIPDVNSDGVLGSFDLATAFMHVANIDELDSSEFPVDFEAAYFPFGDPSSINLSDEADQELAKALASDGIERLFFSMVAIPTAITEHFLRLALTGVAVLLYAGVPFAMLLAFFVYTQAFLGMYIRQFANLLIETFLSVVIAAILISLLAAAAQQGVGLYIGASLITCFVLLWRIKSALKLATAAFELFGGGMVTGGAGGMEMVNMGRRAALGTASLAGAALTGGATMALGGALMASASALQADGRADGAYLGADPAKAEGRAAQLKTIAGYTLGRSQAVRSLVEGGHEVRTLGRNLRDGTAQEHAPDTLDYLRAGSSMSGFGSSPWLAMRLSPSLRGAYDQIGGQRYGYGLLAQSFDEDGAPVTRNGLPRNQQPLTQFANLQGALMELADALSRSGIASPAVERNGSNQHSPPGPPVAPTDRSETTPRTGNSGTPDIWLRDLDSNPPSPVEEAQRRAPTEHAAEDGAETYSQPVPITSQPVISLEPQTPERVGQIEATLAALQGDDMPARQAAFQTLQTYAGTDNANVIHNGVAAHGAPVMQQAAAALSTMVEQYRAEGQSDAELLTTFQSGKATRDLRGVMETPLDDAQLSALADLILLPQRQLTRTELAAAIGQQAPEGNPTDAGVAQAIGSPVNFGGQTGNVRGVIAGAEAMRLSPEEMARLAEFISQGQWESAQRQLEGRGHPAGEIHSFIADLAALPGVLSVPQTTRQQPQPSGDVQEE